MEYCKCGGRIIQTSYSDVCRDCGKEDSVLCNMRTSPGYSRAHSALKQSTYSRRYRFHSLLLKTVLYHTGPDKDDQVWSYLEENRDSLKTCKDIQHLLSRRPLKNKRYDMLGIFCKVFCPDTVPKEPVTNKQIRLAMQLFDALERRWKLARVRKFFSYYYLLERVLNKIGVDFDTLNCKRLICKNRRQFYSMMLARLGGLSFKPPLLNAEAESLREFVHAQTNAGRAEPTHLAKSVQTPENWSPARDETGSWAEAHERGRMYLANRACAARHHATPTECGGTLREYRASDPDQTIVSICALRTFLKNRKERRESEGPYNRRPSFGKNRFERPLSVHFGGF